MVENHGRFMVDLEYLEEYYKLQMVYLEKQMQTTKPKFFITADFWSRNYTK